MSWLKKIVPYNSLHRQILTGKGLSSNINQSGIYCIAYCCQCSTGSIGVQRGPHTESCSWSQYLFGAIWYILNGLKPHYNKSHAICAAMRCNPCPKRMRLSAPHSLGTHRSPRETACNSDMNRTASLSKLHTFCMGSNHTTNVSVLSIGEY